MKYLNDCSRAWRKMMEYFIFEKYNVALNVLKEFDTYGCKYDNPIVPPFHYRYYAGNFWWSKASYIKTLPSFSDDERKNRYWAENWLLLKSAHVFSAFNTPVELYATEIPECVYKHDYSINHVFDHLNFYCSHYFFVLKKLILR